MRAIQTPKVGSETPKGEQILEVVAAAPEPRRVPSITKARVKVRDLKGRERVVDYSVVWKS